MAETTNNDVKEPVAAVATLHSMSTPFLTKPGDVAAYLINMMFANPGGTSDIHTKELICFREIMARHSNSPDAVAEEISEKMREAMDHYFPKQGYTCFCSLEKIDGKGDDGAFLGTHSLTITFADQAGTPIIPRGKFDINEQDGGFKVKYHGDK